MLVMGIAGGVASGKSLISHQLVQLGAVLLDADAIGHRVLQEPAIEQAIRNRWGSAVFDEQGRVSRPAVAKMVFGSGPDSREQLAFLEALTHPRIEARLRDEIERLVTRRDVPAAVLDAAVMFKAGWDRLCDRILFVDTPEKQRIERARARGWTAAELFAREAAQEPLAWKRSRADAVIDNSGTPQEALAQVQRLWQSLVAGQERGELVVEATIPPTRS